MVTMTTIKIVTRMAKGGWRLRSTKSVKASHNAQHSTRLFFANAEKKNVSVTLHQFRSEATRRQVASQLKRSAPWRTAGGMNSIQVAHLSAARTEALFRLLLRP